MKKVGHVAHMGEEREVYMILVGKLKGNRPLIRLRHRWEDGIKMDLRETGYESVEWIHLAQNRNWWQAFIHPVLKLQFLVPQSLFTYSCSVNRCWYKGSIIFHRPRSRKNSLIKVSKVKAWIY
jgi:hypothetical protein